MFVLSTGVNPISLIAGGGAERRHMSSVADRVRCLIAAWLIEGSSNYALSPLSDLSIYILCASLRESTRNDHDSFSLEHPRRGL